MSQTKSLSCRVAIEEHHILIERAKDRNLKPAVLAADVLHKWITDQLVMPMTGDRDSASEQSRLDYARLESLVCRAVWTIIVALSPTLDETAATTVVNELMQPRHGDWTTS